MSDKFPNFEMYDENTEPKFIQFYFREEPYFRTCQDRERFHEAIIERSLRQMGVEEFARIKSIEGEFDIISPRRDNYDVVGMGKFQEQEGGIFVLFGSSYDYGLVPNQKHLDDLARFLPEGIKIRIGGE